MSWWSSKMINKQVLEYKPRCQVNWCGQYHTNLISNDAIKENERHSTAHMLSTKLHDLVNASTRFEDLFKKSQLQTQEANQFKGNKPAAFCDQPMHQWESTLKFYTKLEKLLLSVENFLTEIDEQGLAKNTQQTLIYPAHFIKKNIIKEELLIIIATEIDALEKFVHFTKQIEYTDHDPSLFLEQIENVHGDLSRLLRRPGKHFKMMTERLVNDDLKAWHALEGNQLKEEELRDLNHESVQLYIKLWDERFPDRKGQLRRCRHLENISLLQSPLVKNLKICCPISIVKKTALQHSIQKQLAKFSLHNRIGHKIHSKNTAWRWNNISLETFLAKTKTQGNTGAQKMFFLKCFQVMIQQFLIFCQNMVYLGRWWKHAWCK